MDQSFEIIWSRRASDEFDALIEYIERTNPEAAARLGEAILKHIEILERFPLIGAVYPPGSRSRIREISYKSVRIFYHVEKAPRRLEILAIVHGARQEPDLNLNGPAPDEGVR
jgi:toxin ParE1/3/4